MLGSWSGIKKLYFSYNNQVLNFFKISSFPYSQYTLLLTCLWFTIIFLVLLCTFCCTSKKQEKYEEWNEEPAVVEKQQPIPQQAPKPKTAKPKKAKKNKAEKKKKQEKTEQKVETQQVQESQQTQPAEEEEGWKTVEPRRRPKKVDTESH